MMVYFYVQSKIARNVQVIFLFVDSLSYIYFRALVRPSRKWLGLHRFVCH